MTEKISLYYLADFLRGITDDVKKDKTMGKCINRFVKDWKNGKLKYVQNLKQGDKHTSWAWQFEASLDNVFLKEYIGYWYIGQRNKESLKLFNEFENKMKHLESLKGIGNMECRQM
jgi:hypothetical protein